LPRAGGFGPSDGILAPAVEALRALENFLVLGVGRDAPFDASHGGGLLILIRSAVRQEVFLDVVAVGLEQDGRAAQVADLLLGPLDHAVALALLGVEHLAGAGHPEARFGAALGLHLGHLASLVRSKQAPPRHARWSGAWPLTIAGRRRRPRYNDQPVARP